MCLCGPNWHLLTTPVWFLRAYLVVCDAQVCRHTLHLGRHPEAATQHFLHQIVEAVPRLSFQRGLKHNLRGH